jgi:hypothetical protein
VAWHVPLVPVGAPVSLLGQHTLLADGQGTPLCMLQFSLDLSVVHCQGPAAARSRGVVWQVGGGGCHCAVQERAQAAARQPPLLRLP